MRNSESASCAPLKIGLTGGIGSGKTTIAKLFRKLNYPVYIADTEASRLINQSQKIRDSLIKHFNKQIYNQDNQLDKKVMADIIFNDKAALNKVNRIVHPEVINDFISWSKQQTASFVLFESAIIFESGLAGYLDYIINVTASLETRLKRVVRRDHTTPEKVLERIRNQYDDQEKCEKSDFIINTNENNMILEQVLHIEEQIRISANYCKS